MAAYAKKKNAAAAPKDRPTLAKTSVRDRFGTGFYLFLAFFIPFILMFFAFAVAKVSPFGKNQILVTDLWHQYYPFMVDFQDKLQTGGSLLWTWKSGGGTNYLALMAYYLASPLNFLSVFVPASILREFLMVITCMKVGCAGLFFALFLRITFKRRDAAITAFGVMYALCAFIMGYYWNVIWLDTVALLPLVVAGTFALLREGKFRLYIISLALSILANYYIGLFTCIFVFLVCIGYSIVEFKGWKKLVRDFFRALGCSVVAVMIAAVLVLPAYFALGHTYSSNNTFPQSFAINIGSTADFGGVLQAIGKTISNSVAFVQPTAKEGLPNIYCGVFTIFLAILFLFCSRIKKRERIICSGMLLFFMLSFIIRQLDFIWHGFHFPNMLPHRFSFLYSFVLIYMAFRVFSNIDSVKPVSVIASICGFVIYLGIASRYYHDGGSTLSSLFSTSGADGADPDPVLLSAFFGLVMAAWVLLYSFRERLSRRLQAIFSAVIGVLSTVFIVVSADAFMAPLRGEKVGGMVYNNTGFIVGAIIVMLLVITAVCIALYSKQLNADNRALKTMLSVILLVLAMAEGLISAAVGVKAVGVTDGSYYPLGTDDTLKMVDTIKDREKNNTDLYHSEVNKYYTLNDNALIGVNGISMFNSMVNSRITDYMEKFGMCGWIASNRYTYQESSPFSNLMLNLKYLIAPYGAYLDDTHMATISSSGSVRLMQNLYYLPMGFMVNDDLLNYDVSSVSATEPMENQNQIFRLATGLSGDLYEYLEPSSYTPPEGGAIDGSNGHFTYSSSSNSGTYQIDYTAAHDGVAVAYYDTYYSDNVALKVNDSEVISYYVKRPFIMMIGDVRTGDKISCSASITNSSSGSISCRVALMNEELFQQAYHLFARSTMTASKVTDDTVCGNINAVEDGLFYTSISYVEGWKAYVDGEEVEITPVGDAMLAFKLSKGPHIIELKYTPEGFKVGLIVSILGVLILIAMCILSWRRINLLELARTRIPAFGAKPEVPDLPREGAFIKAAPAEPVGQAADKPVEESGDPVDDPAPDTRIADDSASYAEEEQAPKE